MGNIGKLPLLNLLVPPGGPLLKDLFWEKRMAAHSPIHGVNEVMQKIRFILGVTPGVGKNHPSGAPGRQNPAAKPG